MKFIIECDSIEELCSLRDWLPERAPKPQNMNKGEPMGPLVLSVRAGGVLQAMGIDSIQKLTSTHARDLLRQQNCGKTTLAEIRRALAERGLALSGEEPL